VLQWRSLLFCLFLFFRRMENFLKGSASNPCHDCLEFNQLNEVVMCLAFDLANFLSPVFIEFRLPVLQETFGKINPDE